MSDTKAQVLRTMQIYARNGYKVLPLCSGFVVVGMDGREVGREVRIEDAVEFVDELVMERVA